MWNLQNFPKDAWVCRAPPYCAFIQRDTFEEVYEHRVLINSGPGNGVFPHVAPPTRLHLQFPRETGLILRCAGKIGNTFQTKQENRHSCCNQEGCTWARPWHLSQLQRCSSLIIKHKDLEASFLQDLRGKPQYCPHLMPSSPVIFSLCH